MPWIDVASVLKATVPLAGVVVNESNPGGGFEELAKHLDSMSIMTDRILEASHDLGELTADSTLGAPGIARRKTRVEGSGIRELHALLDSLDPSRKWGGLRRVLTSAGDYLWLCEDHYKDYDPGLPEIPIGQ